MDRGVGLTIAVIGVVLVITGLLAATGLLAWFGRLPGDIRIERPGTRVYVPLVSMLLVSVVLSIALAVIRRLR